MFTASRAQRVWKITRSMDYRIQYEEQMEWFVGKQKIHNHKKYFWTCRRIFIFKQHRVEILVSFILVWLWFIGLNIKKWGQFLHKTVFNSFLSSYCICCSNRKLYLGILERILIHKFVFNHSGIKMKNDMNINFFRVGLIVT